MTRDDIPTVIGILFAAINIIACLVIPDYFTYLLDVALWGWNLVL